MIVHACERPGFGPSAGHVSPGDGLRTGYLDGSLDRLVPVEMGEGYDPHMPGS